MGSRGPQPDNSMRVMQDIHAQVLATHRDLTFLQQQARVSLLQLSSHAGPGCMWLVGRSNHKKVQKNACLLWHDAICLTFLCHSSVLFQFYVILMIFITSHLLHVIIMPTVFLQVTTDQPQKEKLLSHFSSFLTI